METSTKGAPQQGGMARRQFLRYAGAGAAITAGVLSLESCSKNHDVYNDHIDLGSGDPAILNYAYALEQLEAAFYTQVAATPYSGISAQESAYLTDIRDHEIAHREFFKAALQGNAIPGLTPDFSSIDFTSRTSVLGAAKAFEDLGVSAYNGVGYMIKTADYLTLAGKIVSVEARHAALIRELITPNTFIDSSVVDIANTSLEISKTPAQVLTVANKYLSGKKITFSSVGYYY
ncbi:ferritin-like domain-containing protein [Mucilaginibacter sp. KACC 22063]|uniref:ferritin-like domain-containing protein n=1 Tax=Mucilaginibacter sp. KACC 22063 TaxID=3025666 RepID=UPI00236648B1|nr:ferritin-like domain-containing protein [Mucilaginibacter sp. KACC 22063]WDF56980.1 ferritin-like domain-containing protein [Mucilaginibacter sp. KACC 22063]